MDPYKKGMFLENPYYAKTDVCGRLAVVLRSRFDERGLSLIAQPSRCVKRYDVHELICCDEETARPGTTADRIAYLGFVEVTQGGVIVVGDELHCGQTFLGTVAGFDETHMPNHLNIVIFNPQRQTGEELKLKTDDEVFFRQKRD